MAKITTKTTYDADEDNDGNVVITRRTQDYDGRGSTVGMPNYTKVLTLSKTKAAALVGDIAELLAYLADGGD